MHAFAIVLVKPSDDVAGEVERLMAPFSEGSLECAAQYDAEGEAGPGYVPGRFWHDWWRIGGRWDGTIRGLESVDDGEGGFNFGEQFETLVRNVVPVIEMGECRPFTLVTPEGEFRHREHWVADVDGPIDTAWPWKIEADEGFDRWCGEQLLAHRDCLAVGLDYHD